MIATALDSMIGYVAPAWGARRLAARATMSQINAFAGGPGGYDGGKHNRLTKNFVRGNINENAIPVGQLQQLEARSWDLYRNNPHARKIVRSLESKVIGNGLTPQSQAMNADGTPNIDFREWAQELWHAINCELDLRGKPGRGGSSLVEMQRSGLRSCVLGGDALSKMHPLSPREAKEYGHRVPLAVEMIHPSRLDASMTVYAENDNRIYRGIELNARGRRVAYHILESHPSDPLAATSNIPTRVPANEVGHLFVSEDVDQLRGVPWFAPILMQMRDTGDYQFNELMASAMQACTVMAIRRATGQTRIGLQPADDMDMTDADGNPLTAFQPGMVINKGKDGEVEMLTPTPRATNAEAWIQHMLRSTAAGLPGVKSSTITGDYRNSSFSSERSADNDCWPEIEAIQQWFAAGFTQPIWEAVIDAAMLAGYFDGVVSSEEYAARRCEFVCATWTGPVARSINPVDDIDAATKRIAGGVSTLQIECAKMGLNWRDILDQIKEYQEHAAAIGLDPSLVEQYLGIKPEPPAPLPFKPKTNGEDLSGGAKPVEAKVA